MKKITLKIWAIVILTIILFFFFLTPFEWIIGYCSYASYKRQQGWFSIHYANGDLKCKILIKDGKLLEIEDYRGIQGNLIDIGNFKNGNGFLKIYDNDGNLKEKGNVKDGQRDGKWIIDHALAFPDTVLYFYKNRSQYGTYTNWKEVFIDNYSY